MGIKLSRRFIGRLKLSDTPQYKLAWRAGINPILLSHFVTGYRKVKPDDSRILKVGGLLGLTPDECFEITND